VSSHSRSLFLIRLFCTLVLVGCAHHEAIAPDRAPPVEQGSGRASDAGAQQGLATWYGAAFAGRKTASGERFDPNAMTAAHRTLPFGTWVDVVRVDNGLSVRVRINDRGPFGHAERVIDLSRAAADKLGIVRAGVAKVKVMPVAGP
jgi:rare lipoprotein A